MAALGEAFLEAVKSAVLSALAPGNAQEAARRDVDVAAFIAALPAAAPAGADAAKIAALEAQVQALTQQVKVLAVRSTNANARARNSIAKRPADALEPLVDDEGVLPGDAEPALHFPADVEGLRSFSAARCTALLHFYGIAPAAGAVAQRAQLARHLGLEW